MFGTDRFNNSSMVRAFSRPKGHCWSLFGTKAASDFEISIRVRVNALILKDDFKADRGLSFFGFRVASLLPPAEAVGWLIPPSITVGEEGSYTRNRSLAWRVPWSWCSTESNAQTSPSQNVKRSKSRLQFSCRGGFFVLFKEPSRTSVSSKRADELAE